jgi:hypothetical protein
MSVLVFVGESERFFTPTQRHLLNGLLGEGQVSDRALSAWASMVDIDDIDAASYRLIPALYARAGRNPALQPIHGRMKGIYRYFFYRNNKFLAFIETVFSALLSADVEFIVFKGISVLLQYHGSAAGRTASDCDILVRPRDKARAEAVLASCGLAYCYGSDVKHLDRHSHDFTNGAGFGIDLHWYALLECCEEAIDRGFWNRSRRIRWKTLPLRILAPEDELLVAGINGIREIENARADWLQDAGLIFKAVPDFDWRRLHRELRLRGLQAEFLAALALLCRFVPSFPEAVVRKVFRAEIREAATQRVAQNRSFALDAQTDRELTAILAPLSALRRLAGSVSGTDWRTLTAKSCNTVRHIRYELHTDGSIARIYLHRDFLPFLNEIFDIADPALLQDAGNLAIRPDEAEFSLPPGLLAVPAPKLLPQYAAALTTAGESLTFSSPDIAVLPIKVRVTNDSNACWSVLSGSESSFGLSYHLFTEDGALVCWDLPRSVFLQARQGHAVILRPGDSLQLELEIRRPPAAGRYEARIDLIHEFIRWFDPDGVCFPRLLIEVL